MGLYKQANSPYWYIKYKDVKPFSTGTTDRKLAQQFFAKLTYNYACGQLMPEIVQRKKREQLTFMALSEAYEAHAKARHRGYEKMTKTAIRILREHFGDCAVQYIDKKRLRQFQDVMLAKTRKSGKPLSPAYINRIMDEMRNMFGFAVDCGDLDETALKHFKKIKLKGMVKRLRYLSVDEAQRLIDACSDSLRPIVIFALNTGMRRGEILGLKWSQVDLVHSVILLDKTKNGDRREIPINATLTTLLSSLPSRFAGGPVFGLKWTKYAFGKACEKARLADFRFHDLRHTFASQLVMNGVPLATIQQLLGHKSLNMTLRYAHLSAEQHISAVAKLDEILRRKTA